MPKQPMVRQIIVERAIDQLLKAKRYKDIIAETDVAAKLRQRIAAHKLSRSFQPNDPNLRAYMQRQMSVDGAKYYEALLGAGDHAGAAKVAALLVDFDSANAYPELIAAAKRAGDAHAADSLAAEARKAAKPPASP
jgi:hypothetical protein